MNAGTSIKPRLQGRQGAMDLYWPFAAAGVSAHHEIFKKTPFVSGLHSVSRDVVKDIPEIDSIPLLTTTMLDQNVPQGFAVAGRMIAENSTAVTPDSHQDVLRSADERTAALGDVVGLKRNRAIETSFTVSASAIGASNGKLTVDRWYARKSKRTARATNDWSTTHVALMPRDGFTIAGAGHFGGDLENHSYADI